MDQCLDNRGAPLPVGLGLSIQLPRTRGIHLGRSAIRMGTNPSILQTLIGRAASAYTAGPSEDDARIACEYAARRQLASVVCYWNRSEDSPAFVAQSYLRLLQMIRDETHRFAVTYHRKRRELRDFTSELTAIPGVGQKRKGRLLRHFGSIQRVAAASVSELAPFVGIKTAQEIADHFSKQRALAEAGIDAEATPDADLISTNIH